MMPNIVSSVVWTAVLLHQLPLFITAGMPQVSQPGGAGHALLFRNHIIVKKDFKDFPTTAMTVEAWISSNDFCHAGTILSYAKDSKARDELQRIADFNHFVIFDPRNLLACHDFAYIDLAPDPRNESCHASYVNTSKSSKTVDYVERDGTWHHLAVTWSAANHGLTQIYYDGMLMASAYSQKTEPLVSGGALIIGGEQDCFGGCVDSDQGFFGFMDELRIWKTVRTQDDILKHMRWARGLENHADLVGYWHFNEPDNDEGQFRHHTIAKDSSGNGNDLTLETPPLRIDARITSPGSAELSTGSLQFQNSFALNKNVQGMPDKSFTVEFWAKGPAIVQDGRHASTEQGSQNLVSYATELVGQEGREAQHFMDDAIRVERLMKELTAFIDYDDTTWGGTSTVGALAVYINTNEISDNPTASTFMYFDTQWTDDKWHHVAVSWDWESGVMKVLFDGKSTIPFSSSDGGNLWDKPANAGGVKPILAQRRSRGATGSLVLGQDQDCLGGCFSPSNAFNGDMAVVRIWTRALPDDEVRRSMMRERPESQDSLAALYIFTSDGVAAAEGGGMMALDTSGSSNHLTLRSNTPLYVYSTAPLTSSEGVLLPTPQPGAGGYSLALHDKQVLMHSNFRDFPSTALTLEFWMWSVDACRQGVPFSYAHGEYQREDNSFLLFNYNSWGVSVMEDEGFLSDHHSGVSATDGNWHHVAVSWDSSTGIVRLYDNGRQVWQVVRAKGKSIPSGGTLVVGREQDCLGGCFDSATGASGKTSVIASQEYGPQDFFGVIEQMRIWRVVRTPEQIMAGMDADDGRGAGGFDKPGVDPNHPDLVAYWNFDEGSGFTVGDATRHGHDLLMTEKPDWVVTRWLSSCGNRVVEGLEECDGGDNRDGDGCSASCKVESGYTCTGNPSVCVKTGSAPTPGASPTPPPAPAPAPGSPTPTPMPYPSGGGGMSGGGSAVPDAIPDIPKTKTMHPVLTATIVILSIVGGVGLLAFVTIFRRQIGGVVPTQVKQIAGAVAETLGSGAQALRSSIPFMRNRGAEYNPLMSMDPGEMDLDPEFVSSAPFRSGAHSAPGTAGSYHQFVDVRQPSGSAGGVV